MSRAWSSGATPSRFSPMSCSHRQERAEAHRHRPRHGAGRDGALQGQGRRRHHGAGAYVPRYRAQAARGLRYRAGARRRAGTARHHLRPRAVLAANAARRRFPGAQRRRSRPQLHAFRRRAEAPDRQDALRHLDRGDPLLSERHLSPRRAERRQAGAAGGRHRRAPARPGRAAAALRRQGHAGRDRAAQDRARACQAGRGRRGRGARRAVAVEDPRLDRARRAHLQADRRHVPRL